MNQRDKFSLYDHVILNEGAYFFRQGEAVINATVIDALFEKVLDGGEYKVLTVKKRKKELIGGNVGLTAYCSLLIYATTSNPSFFDFEDDAFPKELQEHKLSYLLIVEIRGYVIIIKKNVSHLSSFVNSLQIIDGNILNDVLIDDDTEYRQIKLTNMNLNEDMMRNKMYEANNLQNTMPLFGSNRNIVTTVRFSTSESLCTLNVNTSRISKFGDKKNIPNLLLWINKLVEALENHAPKVSFLSHFAMPIAWKKLYDRLIPASLLIDTLALERYIGEKLDDISVYRKDEEGNYEEKTALFRRLIKNGIKCWMVSRQEDGTYRCDGNIGIAIKQKKTGIRLTTYNGLDSLYYHHNGGKYVKLIDLINASACFSVGFADYSYIYYARRIYQNSNINRDLDAILEVFEAYPRLQNVTSEKGKNTAVSTHFSEDSVFHIVENEIFPHAQYLVCDDMGNEWADHIAIQRNTISYIHSKCFNKTSLSASNFQVVIGQAVKNIGNLTPDDAALEQKRRTLQGCMAGTSISKCRKGSADGFVDSFKKMLIHPNLSKEVCIAIDFISKSQLTTAFENLKNDVSFRQKYPVIQMVWLLNGFISICKDADLHCRIFCKP